MSEEYAVPRVPFDVRDLIQNLGNMKAESDQRIANLEAQLRSIRVLLNPTCAEESIEGAIRNLQQAHLSATGNVTTLQAQLREKDADKERLEALERMVREHGPVSIHTDFTNNVHLILKPFSTHIHTEAPTLAEAIDKAKGKE